MKTTVQKWGNSHAVRIPLPFVKEAGLSYGAAVDLSVEEGKLVIAPTSVPTLKLEDLLREVTPENVHAEVETGPPVGREAW